MNNEEVMRNFNRRLGGLLEEHRRLLRVARAAKAALATNPKIIVGDHYVWAELQEALKEVEDLL